MAADRQAFLSSSSLAMTADKVNWMDGLRGNKGKGDVDLKEWNTKGGHGARHGFPSRAAAARRAACCMGNARVQNDEGGHAQPLYLQVATVDACSDRRRARLCSFLSNHQVKVAGEESACRGELELFS